MMARRTVKGFLVALKAKIESERALVDVLRSNVSAAADRAKREIERIEAETAATVLSLEAEIERKNIQIDALNGVVEELSAPIEDDRDEAEATVDALVATGVHDNR
jgi:hypothetical protein